MSSDNCFCVETLWVCIFYMIFTFLLKIFMVDIIASIILLRYLITYIESEKKFEIQWSLIMKTLKSYSWINISVETLDETTKKRTFTIYNANVHLQCLLAYCIYNAYFNPHAEHNLQPSTVSDVLCLQDGPDYGRHGRSARCTRGRGPARRAARIHGESPTGQLIIRHDCFAYTECLIFVDVLLILDL